MFTVKELINALKKADPDAPVAFSGSVQGGRMLKWVSRAEIEHGRVTLK